MFSKSKRKSEHNKKLAQIETFIESNRFSTIPGMLSKITQVTSDPFATISDYVKVCEMDQSACIRILKSANSAAFGTHTGEPIRTMKDAVVRLGMRRTREILTGTVLSPMFKKGEHIGAYSPSALWTNSVAVAASNRITYEHLKLAEPQDCDPYLVGLLHNMGLPLEQQCFYNQGFQDAIQASQKNHTPLFLEENHYLGINHTEVGEYLTHHWNMPTTVSTVIRAHHEIGASLDTTVETLVHVTRASQWLAQEKNLGYAEFSDEAAEEYLASFKKLGITPQMYETLAQELETEIQRWTRIGWFSELHLRQAT